MSFNRKCLILTHKKSLLAAAFVVICLFDSVCVYAKGRYCTQTFGPSSHPFFKHLYDGNPASPKDRSASVEYLGIRPDGRIAFRQKKTFWTGKTRSWESTFNLVPEGSVPQGDIRTFIYLAGPELARKFGFEFVEDKDGLLLLVPSAARIEKTVRALNRYLIANRHEPIAYFPKESGYLEAGEALRLATKHDHTDGVRAQSAYADHDPKIASHEVSYHLGPIFFSEVMSKKSDAINLEVARVSKLLWESNLPLSIPVSDRLVESRESELDIGNANLQHYVALFRKVHEMDAYENHSIDSVLMKPVYSSLSVLASPYYSPSEHAARRLIVFLGLEAEFKDHPELLHNRDYIYKDEIVIYPMKSPSLKPEAKTAYVRLIRKILETQHLNPNNAIVESRQYSRDWIQALFKSMDQRIQVLLDAFDSIGPIR